MPRELPTGRAPVDRRDCLRLAAAALATWGVAVPRPGRAQTAKAGTPTRFQIACMTLPYNRFSLQRALEGIKRAGYEFVAWGTTHLEGNEKVPALALDAPVDRARELGRRTRDLGLEPVMMFGPSPEQIDALKHRIRQAEAAGVAQVLTMGTTRGNDLALWVKNFRELGPFARDRGVIVAVKPHGGNTDTGKALAAVTRAVDDDGIKISYDAGNVMDYHDVDPIPDVQACVGEVRSLCIKDHRNFPKDQDCGPGFGVIDHYRLLQPFVAAGRPLPLCCENIAAPLLPAPDDPAALDALARRAREFLETVTAGLQA